MLNKLTEPTNKQHQFIENSTNMIDTYMCHQLIALFTKGNFQTTKESIHTPNKSTNHIEKTLYNPNTNINRKHHTIQEGLHTY